MENLSREKLLKLLDEQQEYINSLEQKFKSKESKSSPQSGDYFLKQNTSDVVFIQDMDFNILYVSDSVEKIFGYTAEEMYKLRPEHYMAEEYISTLTEIFFEHLEKARQDDSFDAPFVESVYIKKDGSKFYGEFKPKFVKDENGEVVSIHGLLRDITKRKNLENKLIHQRELYLNVINSAKEIIYQLDGNGKLVFINKYAEEISGFKIDEILGKHFALFVYEKDLDSVNAKFKSVLNGNIEEYETRMVDKNRNIKWLYIYATPVMNNGEFENILCFGKDITETKNSKMQLDLSEKRYKLLAETARDLILTHDLNGNITFINPAVEELTGYKKEDLLGENVSSLVAPEYYGQMQLNKEHRLNNVQDNFLYETEILDAKGNRILLEINTAPIMEKGNILGILVIARNIMDRKRVENELKRQNEEYQKLNKKYKKKNVELRANLKQMKIMNNRLNLALKKAEESEKLKSAFLSNMCHEIRTPMSGILGFASILKKTNIEEIKRQEYLKVIERSGKRMLNIIEGLLDISLIHSGQMNLALNEVNVNLILEEYLDIYKEIIDEDKIELILKTPLSSKRSFIVIDRVKFKKVIDSLLSNAVKFTQKGKIIFGYKLIRDFLEFYVEDSGIGISYENQKSIFNHFNQVDSRLSREYQGAGIGLSISKSYVEKMGGEMRVESKFNQGSTFYFTIPYKCAAKPDC